MLQKFNQEFEILKKQLNDEERLGKNSESRIKVLHLLNGIANQTRSVAEGEKQQYIELYNTISLFQRQLPYERALIGLNNNDDYIYKYHVEPLNQLIQNDNRKDFKASVALEIIQTLLLYEYPYLSSRAIKLAEKNYQMVQELGTSLQQANGKRFFNEFLRQQQGVVPSLELLKATYLELNLHSIAKHGLRCSSEQEFSGLQSVDGGYGGDYISVNSVNLAPVDENSGKPRATDFKSVKNYLRNDQWAGYLHIAMERASQYSCKLDNKAQLRSTLEQRLLSSVVFIANHPALHYPNFLNHCEYIEQRIEQVLPQSIQAVLVPEPLIPLLEPIFSDKKLIPVPIKTLQVQPTESVMQYIKVADVSQAELSNLEFELKVPDYEAGLEKYIAECQPKRFMLHLTRLMTSEDMQILLKKEKIDFQTPLLSYEIRFKLWDQVEHNILRTQTLAQPLEACAASSSGSARAEDKSLHFSYATMPAKPFHAELIHYRDQKPSVILDNRHRQPGLPQD